MNTERLKLPVYWFLGVRSSGGNAFSFQDTMNQTGTITV